MKNFKLSLLFIIICTFVFSQDANIWKRYTGQINNSNIPVLSNYSFAGYKLGTTGIPNNLNLQQFNITDYGAVANDNTSDQSAIQAAIDAAEANGGGIVFFPSGEFIVNTSSDGKNGITINHSNIVLKGSGSEKNKTVINMKTNMTPPNSSPWATIDMFRFFPTNTSTQSTNITQNRNRGDYTIKVQNASIFMNKKYIELRMNNNSNAANDYLGGKTPRSIWSTIVNQGVALREIHEIASVNTSNNTITLKDPIVDNIKSSYGWKAKTINLLEGCGFQDIYFKGNYTTNFQHHASAVDDYGWRAVGMKSVANSWITRCRFSNITGATRVSTSFAVSVLNILIDGNRGHDCTIANGGSTRILQGLIWDNTNKGQWHGPNIDGYTSACVIWRVEAPKGRGFDLHAAQPRTNLIDMYHSKNLLSGSGGHYKNNPNHLTGLTLWNNKQLGSSVSNHNFWNDCNSNYCGLTVVNPVIVGMHGADVSFVQSNVKYEESNGTKVSPESLYEAQLSRRLGNSPQWINASISKYNQLKTDWYNGSNVSCSDGIQNQDETGVDCGGPCTNCSQSPYNGTTSTIPGTIQVEDFDLGGEDVAYNDTSSGNAGNKYRTNENVDIRASGDSGGGYTIGWIANGEWMEYTTNVTSGTYKIEARVSSNNDSPGGLKFELNGTNLGTINIDNTSGWNNYTTKSLNNVTISGGTNKVLRLTAVDGGSFDINWVKFTPVSSGNTQTAYGGSNRQIPGTIQAEDFDNGGEDVAYNDTSSGNTGNEYRTNENVDIAVTQDTGGGYTIGWIANGEWMEYTTNVTSGNYKIEARVASNSNGVGGLKIELDGVNLGTINVERTNSWNNYVTKNINNITISGSNNRVLRLTAIDGGLFNINWIKFTATSGNNSTSCNDGIQNQGETGVDCGGPCSTCGQNNTGNCSLPWTSANQSITKQTVNWTSPSIDISCASKVNVSMDIEGLTAATMESSDYLNIYYKVDGGNEVAISENTDGFALKGVFANSLSGNNLKIIIRGKTSWQDETYNISNILVENVSNISNRKSSIIVNNAIKLYPNPATKFITIEGLDIKESITLHDALGRVLNTPQISSDKKMILDVSTFPDGIYFIKTIKNGTYRFVKK